MPASYSPMHSALLMVLKPFQQNHQPQLQTSLRELRISTSALVRAYPQFSRLVTHLSTSLSTLQNHYVKTGYLFLPLTVPPPVSTLGSILTSTFQPSLPQIHPLPNRLMSCPNSALASFHLDLSSVTPSMPYLSSKPFPPLTRLSSKPSLPASLTSQTSHGPTYALRYYLKNSIKMPMPE